MNQGTLDVGKAPYRREVRLGMVLFGGISLAIYMNGIALEFFRAVRGRGIYGLLKEITNSEIIVDVISGTSAGGINGIFLAYALANEFEFGACSDLWRKQGALGKLLHSPFDGPLDSVLNSRGYYVPKLQEAFSAMKKRPAQHDLKKAGQYEIDLFVTGTNFYGDAYTSFDDGGHAIDLMEYRSLFKLKHRPNRQGFERSDFAPHEKTEDSLGKLAAITSCFPVAFAPVHVTGNAEDDLLRRWGQLDSPRFFVDGGVLANKPFTPTIAAIFSRSTDRQVDRYLCYVEPDPEVFASESPSSPPNVVRNAVDSISKLPSYQSISADLEEVAQHNNRVEQFKRLTKACVGNTPEHVTQLYKKSRLLSISDRVLTGIFRVNRRDPLLNAKAKDAGRQMVNCFEENFVVGEVSDCLLRDFDVYFRRRRLDHVSYYIYSKLFSGTDVKEMQPAQRERLLEVWRMVNRFRKTLEILQYNMEWVVDEFDFCWEEDFTGAGVDPNIAAKELWAKVDRLLRYLLRSEGLTLPDPESPTELTDFNEALKNRARSLTRKLPSEILPDQPNILVELDQSETAFLSENLEASSDVRREYLEFELLDNLVFPAELVSGLVSKDTIQTIRFSPLDAEIGACNLKPKILGRHFAAFGGFFKEDWRSNDILFGRLDGACQLTELLLSRFGSAAKRTREEAAEIEGRFMDSDGIFNLGWRPIDFFPNCNSEALEPFFRAAVRGCWTRDVITGLVNAAHAEILIDDFKEREGPAGEERAKSLLRTYGTPREYLRSGHTVRSENAWSLVRPASVPVAVKVATALALVGLGLFFGTRKQG